MELSERYNLDRRMICIDFKKAFDTVSRDFLFCTLSSFGFGPSFLQWIHTFYNKISICDVNNGFSTQHFTVERGVRQGNPLSAYLFIIALEILCISMCNSKDVHEEEIRLCLFTDDLTGFLKDFSLLNFLKLIEDYRSWKRVSCHGNKMFYSLRCVFYRTISLSSFNDLRCKLARIALFTQILEYWVECMTSSVISFA